MRWIAFVLLVTSLFLQAIGHGQDPEGVVPPSPASENPSRLSLSDCEAMAMAVHPRLFEANAKISEAQGGVVQAGLYPNPRIDSGNPQVVGPNRTSVYSVGVMQEVIRGGKRHLDIAAAEELVHQAEWDSVRKRFEVLTDVRQDFFGTLAAQRRKALLEKLLDLAKRSEKTSESLLTAQQVSETDLLLLRIERRKAETALQGAEINLLNQRRKLAASIGVRAGAVGMVEGKLTAPVPDFDDDGVLTQVLTNNPIVQIASIDVNRMMILLQRAEAEPIQNITIQGGTQYQESTANFQALVGLYVDVPLWNRNQGNIMSAQASIHRATANRNAIQMELTKILVDAISRFRVAEKTVQNYEEGILPDAMRTLELVQKAYEGRQFEISRLLQTQRTVFEANIDYVSALEIRLKAAAEISGLLQLDMFPLPDE